MDDHCVRCHGSFSSQKGVLSSIDDIDRAAAAGPDAVNTWMPEDGELSDHQRERLGQWLACGAP
jgi:hypothetical protein